MRSMTAAAPSSSYVAARRESLMTVFWPDAAPGAARNSLNVAIHGLRRSLRAVAGDHPVVLYRDGCYFLDPAVDLWVDIEAFEDLVTSARRHLAGGDPAAAQAGFHAAAGLYHGEFLADNPHERWAQVTREHLGWPTTTAWTSSAGSGSPPGTTAAAPTRACSCWPVHGQAERPQRPPHRVPDPHDPLGDAIPGQRLAFAHTAAA